MKQIHDLQLLILRKLLFAESLKYSQLKPSEEMENNQLSFHLDKLIENGWVQKQGENYVLTNSGKEYANRMDTDIVKIKRQSKISVVACAIRDVNPEREFLIYTRLKHPFYGFQGFPTGKLEYGESLAEGIIRELNEETGLVAVNPELFTIRHYRNYSPQRELLEDKIMFMFRIMNPTGEIKPSNEGKHEWVKESEMEKYLNKPFNDLADLFAVLQKFDGNVQVLEQENITADF